MYGRPARASSFGWSGVDGVSAMAVVTHPAVAAASATAVWQQYRRTGDPRLRDRIVFTLTPLVRHAGARTDEQAALGLRVLAAVVEVYAPQRDGGLELFAWTQVRAALA